MFEHLGYKNYAKFMQVAHKFLKDDGLFLLHTIGNKKSITYSELWTSKYIFPHGMLPSLAQIALAAEDYFVVEDFHNFGADYDLTLMAWLKNFEDNWHLLKDKYGDRFYRVWKYFLCSCAGSFRARNIQLWQLVLSKNGILNGYKSAQYL
jgi:cyclopropane-fatty-acyl-phospholipid synthase